MFKISSVALVMLTLCACTSGPSSEWRAETSTKLDASTMRIEAFTMPANIEGMTPGTDWRVSMAREGKEQFAQGINDANGKLRATDDGELLVSVEATRVNNGDGGGHYMGANPEASVEAVATVRDRGGRVLATLRGTARRVSYRGSPWAGLCYELGEEFKSWYEGQR